MVTSPPAMPTAAIGADVMVGFPGETEEEFEQSRDFIASQPFTYLHVFTYSERPGTPAAEAPGKEQAGSKETTEKEAKEAKEGREADAMRNAPLVPWIAKKTGLSNNAVYWLCVLLNFGIVFTSITIVVRKFVPVKFRNRTESIQKRLEEARKTSEDARRRLAEVEGRLSRLDVDAAYVRRPIPSQCFPLSRQLVRARHLHARYALALRWWPMRATHDFPAAGNASVLASATDQSCLVDDLVRVR